MHSFKCKRRYIHLCGPNLKLNVKRLVIHYLSSHSIKQLRAIHFKLFLLSDNSQCTYTYYRNISSNRWILGWLREIYNLFFPSVSFPVLQLIGVRNRLSLWYLRSSNKYWSRHICKLTSLPRRHKKQVLIYNEPNDFWLHWQLDRHPWQVISLTDHFSQCRSSWNRLWQLHLLVPTIVCSGLKHPCWYLFHDSLNLPSTGI